MSAVRGAVAILALALALGGCAIPGYDHVDLEPSGMLCAGVVLASASVEVPEGLVVEVNATAMSADGPLGGDFSFDLVSADPNVLGVSPALGQPAGTAVFVFFGAAPGTTQIDVLVGGKSERPIPATVTSQP